MTSSSTSLPPPLPLPLPLHLTIRFSNALPDLDLDIPSPKATTVLALKQTLRSRLDTKNRLRLIHQGRLLPDTSALSAVLKQAPPPPPKSQQSQHSDVKGKGKAFPIIRTYVNCSIGDELEPEELEAEAAAALKPPDSDNAAATTSSSSASKAGGGVGGANSSASTRPRPRGFDRLLQSGFTASEVSTLRTQFTSIQTARHTPDDMPSPDTMRNMEDAWIDNNAGGLPSGDNNPLEDEFTGLASVLDLLIRALMVGFFFPLGSVAWLMREEGIWSKRCQFFVGFGVVLSVAIGVMRSLSV